MANTAAGWRWTHTNSGDNVGACVTIQSARLIAVYILGANSCLSYKGIHSNGSRSDGRTSGDIRDSNGSFARVTMNAHAPGSRDVRDPGACHLLVSPLCE